MWQQTHGFVALQKSYIGMITVYALRIQEVNRINSHFKNNGIRLGAKVEIWSKKDVQ